MNEALPISHNQAIKAHTWLTNNFGHIITKQDRYSPELVSAIFCQETAQRVLLWVDKYPADIVLQRCVFDASGDAPNSSRNAFPKNAAEFHNRYGDEFTDMLIAEANKMRRMPQPGDADGWGASHFLYKGYGIFQMDLQHVVGDELFFRNKLWYDFEECFNRLTKELDTKKALSANEREMVRRYNGAGVNAENYADNVMEFKAMFK